MPTTSTVYVSPEVIESELRATCFEVERLDGYAELVSVELWFYEGDTRKGLPAFFYLLFFPLELFKEKFEGFF